MCSCVNSDQSLPDSITKSIPPSKVTAYVGSEWQGSWLDFGTGQTYQAPEGNSIPAAVV